MDIKKNTIIEIPAKIAFLTKLKRLDMSYNSLTTIDIDITQLLHLKSVNLRSNKLGNSSGVSYFGSMDTLQKLNLKENYLTELPSTFYLLKLSSLKLDTFTPLYQQQQQQQNQLQRPIINSQSTSNE